MKYRIRILPHYHLKQKPHQLRCITPSRDYTPELFFKRNFLVVPSGRWGISAILKKLRLKTEDEVYISTSSGSPYVTSCVTCTIFNHCKPSRVLSNITKVIFIIHEFGIPDPETVHLLNSAKSKGIVVIEDCAHTFDSKLNGQLVGTFGDYTVYSLTKIFPMAEGGIITGSTLDFPELNDLEPGRIESIKEDFATYLPYLPEFSKIRRRNFSYLRDKFGGDFLTNEITPYLFPLKLKKDVLQFVARMDEKGVECGVWYGKGAVLLPIHPMLDEDDLDYMVKVIKSLY